MSKNNKWSDTLPTVGDYVFNLKTGVFGKITAILKEFVYIDNKITTIPIYEYQKRQK